MNEPVYTSARRQATRERLLDAAVDAFAAEGYQGVSVEAICSRAGFTRGAFYSNFESKEQLFLALLEREFARRIAAIDAKAAELTRSLRDCYTPVTPEVAVQHIVDFFSDEHDALVWLALESEFLLLALRDHTLADGYQEFSRLFFPGVGRAVQEILDAVQRTPRLPLESLVSVLITTYHQFLRNAALSGVTSQADLNTPERLNTLAEMLTELLFSLTEPKQ